MPDTNASTALPQVSKRYKTESIIGQGGMGVIYRAYDTVTLRPVAVKTMWGDIDPAALELFGREWTVVASLSHPNIVDLLDRGEFKDDNGQSKPYFVMPLLPGKTLDEIIKKQSQRLTVDRVVEIICQACRGLQAAHDKNLVHRDLKPSNIFVMDDDTAKIIDFGVAHLADAHSLTGIKGTLQYMAPEQLDMASANPVSPRSDIFSLAVVTYEALTGRKPFARRTEADTIDAIRTHIPPPASEINGAVNNLIARTVHKAMAKQPWHRFTTAKEFSDTLQRAMRNEPIERFDRAKIQPRIERVKKAYSDGDNQFAMEILTELESEGHIDPDMPVLRMQIEQSVRQRNIRQLLESARTRMEGDEHPLALQKLGEVLALDPNNMDAISLRSQIERQRSEKQIDQWFRLVEEHRENHLFSQARQGLQEILNIDSSNTRARTMLAEIDQTEHQINKFKEEKQRLYEGAMASYQNGEISSALSKLERGLDLSRQPNARALTTELDAQYQSFYNQVRSERDMSRNAYAEGRKSLEDKNTVRALEICEEYLQKHPSDPMFQALKLEAEEMQRQEQSAAIAEVNRRADLEPDLDKKYNTIKEACERFPNEPHFKSSLKLIRDRRDLVNSIVARARQYEERGQFGESANQWDILRNIYPVYPGLDFEVERLNRRREEHANAEAKAHWMERIDGHFAAGEYSKARDVIKEALADFKNDKELEGLESLAEQGIRRSAEASVLLTQGRDLCGAKNFGEGLDALRKAERLDPRNVAARATLLSCLVEHARELISKDWRAAEPLIQEASGLNADDPVVRSLTSLLESHKRQESIGNILVEARGLQASNDLAAALKKVEDGLAEYPNEVRLAQLQNTLRAAAAALKSESAHASGTKSESAAVSENAKTTAVGAGLAEGRDQLRASPQALSGELPKTSPSPSQFAATTIQPLQTGLKQPGEQKIMPAAAKPDPNTKGFENNPRTPNPPIANRHPPQVDGPKKPMWLLAALAGLVLIVGSLLYSLIHHAPSPSTQVKQPTAGVVGSPTGSKVNLTANQPGATFKVDGTATAASTTLKPGEHTGEADLDGFSSDVHQFIVNNTGAPVTVAFVLSQALPELRFNSGLSGGNLILDDATPVDLQEGAFSKGDIPLGDHKVRIVDGDRELISFAFNAAPKQMIKLTELLTRRGGSAIVISSLGGSAQLYATPGFTGSRPNQTPQAIPAEGLAFPASSQPQRITVTDGKSTRALTPDPSPLPVLTVFLNGGLEKIPVTITANVPDGSVLLDGTELKRKLANGSRLLPLVPGVYNISVARDGYQDSVAQRIVIKAGDSPKHLSFQLSAVTRLATLAVAGAPADAAIFIDEVRAGTINGVGGFTKEISPATHQIVVRKAGLEEFKQTHEFKAGETLTLQVQMRPPAASIALHVTPPNAKITLKRDSEIYTPQNGQTANIPPGNYVLTASADEFRPRTENIQIEAGKQLPIEWFLQAMPHLTADTGPAIPFVNSKSWTAENGWLTHTGGGLSFFNGGAGSHVFEIQKTKKRFRAKPVVFYADYAGPGNYTQYSLDGHTLLKKVFTENGESNEIRLPFSIENSDTIRMTVEFSADNFTIKNRYGAVVDNIRKTHIGRFAFGDDLTLRVTQ